eukprot:UN29046
MDGKVQSFFLKGTEFSDGSFGSDIPTTGLSHLFNVNNFIVSQVNPHILPLQKMPHIPVVWAVFQYIMNEFKLAIDTTFNFLGRYGLLPRSLTWLHSSLVQQYFGDITIFPDFSWKDFTSIISKSFN